MSIESGRFVGIFSVLIKEKEEEFVKLNKNYLHLFIVCVLCYNTAK